MLSCDAAMYIYSISPLIGVVSVGRISMNSFNFWKAASASILHWKIFLSIHPLRVLKNGSDRSAPFDKNLLKAASFPLRLCTSFNVFGDCRSVIAFTFEGFALIPCFVIKCPRNYPSSTPNEHFFGLSFIFMALSWLKVSWMSEGRSSSVLLFMTMSSTYASKFLPICLLKALSTRRW
jgi:hypothetical protein